MHPVGAGRGRPVGYRGKLEERARARELRAQAWTMPEIAEHLGVSKSSVSLWTRDVPFDPGARRSSRTDRRPRGSDHPLRRRKLAEIARTTRKRRERTDRHLTDRELLVAGVGLYAGDGSKTDGRCASRTATPPWSRSSVHWLRRCFVGRGGPAARRLYLHEGLDLDAAQRVLVRDVTGVPRSRFGKPYRAVPMRRSAQQAPTAAPRGYACADTHRRSWDGRALRGGDGAPDTDGPP
jgi:hypothetical protein